MPVSLVEAVRSVDATRAAAAAIACSTAVWMGRVYRARRDPHDSDLIECAWASTYMPRGAGQQPVCANPTRPASSPASSASKVLVFAMIYRFVTWDWRKPA